VEWGMTISSALIPLLLGVALATCSMGSPSTVRTSNTGLFQLLLPLACERITTLCVPPHGCHYLMLKHRELISGSSARRGIGVAAVVVVFGFHHLDPLRPLLGLLPSPSTRSACWRPSLRRGSLSVERPLLSPWGGVARSSRLYPNR